MLYQIKGGERSHVGPITRIKDMSKFISRTMLTFIINAYILAMKMMIIYEKTTKNVCITFIEMRDADEQ